MLRSVTRFVWLALVPLLGCSTPTTEPVKSGYQGTVQKVFRVVRQSAEVPFMSRLRGAFGSAVAPNAETHQYVVRTPKGQIIAQSDEEFPVGECVQVIPQGDSTGPAFRYGEAEVVRSQSCG